MAVSRATISATSSDRLGHYIKLPEPTVSTLGEDSPRPGRYKIFYGAKEAGLVSISDGWVFIKVHVIDVWGQYTTGKVSRLSWGWPGRLATSLLRLAEGCRRSTNDKSGLSDVSRTAQAL